MSCANWNKPDKGNVDQDNNGVERLVGAIIRDYTKGKDLRAIYRETCGPSSLEAGLEGLGIDQRQCGLCQPSDYYTILMNDKRVVDQPGWSLPVNRYPEAYPVLVAKLYPVIRCRVEKLPAQPGKLPAFIRDILKTPNKVAMLNLIDPGHYVMGLHIDEKDIVYYNDSWLADYWNPASTHKRSIPLAKLCENIKYAVVTLAL